jgi:hypothetical protein
VPIVLGCVAEGRQTGEQPVGDWGRVNPVLDLALVRQEISQIRVSADSNCFSKLIEQESEPHRAPRRPICLPRPE